jgi:hypothetical protein
MGNPPQQAVELEVEQTAMGRLEDMGPPAEVVSGSTTEIDGDHMVGLTEECRLGGTWVEHPR